VSTALLLGTVSLASAAPVLATYQGTIQTASGSFAVGDLVNLSVTYDDASWLSASPPHPEVISYGFNAHWFGSVGSTSFDWTGYSYMNVIMNHPSADSIDFVTNQADATPSLGAGFVQLGLVAYRTRVPGSTPLLSEGAGIMADSYATGFSVIYSGGVGQSSYGAMTASVPEPGVLETLAQF
jgi:hypothetical protein